MRGYGHISGLGFQRLMDHLFVGAHQSRWIVTAVADNPLLLSRTEIGPDGVIELQVPAPGSIEPPYGIGISLGGIGEEIFNVRISLPGHHIAPLENSAPRAIEW
jgi:hypothetical protein